MEINKIDLDSQPQGSPPSSAATTPTVSVSKKPPASTILLFVIVLLLGIPSGILAKKVISKRSGTTLGNVNKPSGDSFKKGDVFGSDSESLFPDSATGVLEKGGIDGEGTHKLLRPGGISQTAYLTSSVLDLDEFVGHKITVWGETFAAQKAGWLMDVGRVKIEELNATPPTE